MATKWHLRSKTYGRRDFVIFDFVMCALQPAWSLTCTLSAARFPVGRCRFIENSTKFSLFLDACFPFLALPMHVFPEQCSGLSLSSWVAYQRQRGRIQGFLGVWVLSSWLALLLWTPTMWRGCSSIPLSSSWHWVDICSGLLASSSL